MSEFDEPFESEILQERDEPDAEATRLPGWSYDETQAPAPGSVGRFDRLEEDVRHRLIQTFQSMQFKASWMERHRLPVANMKELCDALGYGWREQNHVGRPFNPWKEQWKIQWGRALRLYPNSLVNYPFNLRPTA